MEAVKQIEASSEYVSEYEKIRNETLLQVLKIRNYSEEELLNLANKTSTEEKNLILRNIFLQSRKFALKIVEDKKKTLCLEEIIEFINLNKIPCVSGEWTREESGQSFQLKRYKCNVSDKNNPFLCQYWREAADGLIMGLGESERFARHRSLMYGGNNKCVDQIYDSDYIDCRWGKVPEKFKKICKPLIKNFEKIQVEIILSGYSEKTLFYTINDKNKSLNNFRRGFVISTIQKYFQVKSPETELVEITPRAVIEEGF